MNKPSTAILLADIGGTNARFALMSGGRTGSPAHFDTAAYATPVAAIRAFLHGFPASAQPLRAVIAGAGPVEAGRIHMTNAGWTLDAAELARELGLKSVEVINDFAALAWALPALTSADVRPLGGGAAVSGAPQAIIGAGTGFGLAIRIGDGKSETTIATEGGHASLAAESAAEDAVLLGLRTRYGHVSAERVLSGPGLLALYTELAGLAGETPEAATAADIVTRALADTGPHCLAALQMFCGWFGSVAGDIALVTGALGGVYLAGGVATHFMDFLAASTFRARFEAKGRMTVHMRAIPVFAIIHEDPAFLGLTRYAEAGGS